MASLGGLALGIALAFASELNKDLLLGEWELPPNATVLGRIPKMDMTPEGHGRSRRRKAAVQNLAATGSMLLLLVGIVITKRGGV
jgi:hypothetical protein